MLTPLPDLVDFHARYTDARSEILAEDPLEVVTPAAQWNYALWAPTTRRTPGLDVAGRIVLSIRVQVRSGSIGVGWTLIDSDQFIVEQYVTEGSDETISLRVPIAALPGRLMFRNVSPFGPSRFVLFDVLAQLKTGSPPYPVALDHRDVRRDASSLRVERDVFDDTAALAINKARLHFLTTLDLPLTGKRVLDAGCGVGHHTPFYSSKGCDVVGIDGRPENIAVMKELYPDVRGVVGDLQNTDLEQLGPFDVVHCFGLLYHLDSPIAGLRRLVSVCREYLILETMVCDSKEPLMVLADEPTSANQALGGLGCRPSPSFVAMALDRLGFRHVYGTAHPPAHPDFLFEWRNGIGTTRDGHNLRCMFVASRTPIQRESLVELV